MPEIDNWENPEASAHYRKAVREAEERLKRRKRLDPVVWGSSAACAVAVLTGACGTVVTWGDTSFVKADIVCAILAFFFWILSLAARGARPEIVKYRSNGFVDSRRVPPRRELEATLQKALEEQRIFEAKTFPSLRVRQRLYHEDVSSVIEQYQVDAQKYRKTHNRLQSLIIVGSLTTTTVAALDVELSPQRIATVGVSFIVGLAAGFTGYFKFRERSFYLQQTADSIEQEANAMTLQVGEYRDRTENEALARLVERVEFLRNEQRRRQQQLDQPTDVHDSRSIE